MDIEELKQRLINEREHEDIAICLIEEMSELTKVLTKALRQSPKFSMNDLAEEIAHVMLMCETAKNKYEVPQEEIDWNIKDALCRCFKINKEDVK